MQICIALLYVWGCACTYHFDSKIVTNTMRIKCPGLKSCLEHAVLHVAPV